jgi:ERCC4-type nuclease
MKLFVDSREPLGLIELLKVRVKNIEFGNLDIGDFIIKNDNNEIVMIFERKSLNDLISSIKDGRYNEQSFRLSNFPLNNHHIYYVIEGNITDFISKNNEQTRKMLFSSMLSLSYTKGFSLLRASGWLETVEFLIRFMEKLEKMPPPKIQNADLKSGFPENGEVYEELSQQPQQYSDVIKTTKKSNITKNNIGEIMLSQIPGVSIVAAQSLMVEYKTIKNLINILEKDERCLDNFKIECKNGSRKISKTTVKNLIEYLVKENI